ncbi:MAG: hypothetical protein NVS1B6_08590 [Steroidobacteraceae bacterium]
MNSDMVVRDQEILEADVTHNALVMPVAAASDIVAAVRAYEETRRAIIDPKTDMQSAGGKSFIKRSGWTKLALAFGVSAKSKEGYPLLHYDADGRLEWAECKVEAITPNGRSEDGWASCWAYESRFGKAGGAGKIGHDLPATAETRARNRAYANLFGMGEVSYEEAAGLEEQYEARGGYPDSQVAHHEGERPKASPNNPATPNQIATIEKLSKYLDKPAGLVFDGMNAAQASEVITQLSTEYNEKKSSRQQAKASF